MYNYPVGRLKNKFFNQIIRLQFVHFLYQILNVPKPDFISQIKLCPKYSGNQFDETWKYFRK